MSEIRRDAISGKWVILSALRSKRPSDFIRNDHSSAEAQGTLGPCAFCIHHEHETGAELFAFRESGVVSAPDWRVRVVQNIYPAVSLDIEVDKDNSVDGTFQGCSMPGFGSHEVVIETPNHKEKLTSLPCHVIEEVLKSFRHRMRSLTNDGRFKYVQVFKNKGKEAGASMQHSHSQIIALPIIPHDVQLEIDGAKSHYQRTGKCIFCDILQQELMDGSRLIECTSEYVVITLYAPRYPYETWIVPRVHSSNFEDASGFQLQGLATALLSVLKKIEKVFNDAPYNYMLHTYPMQDNFSVPFYHWSIRVVPHLSVLGGFEIGSGCHIVQVFPEKAAADLRDVDVNSKASL